MSCLVKASLERLLRLSGANLLGLYRVLVAGYRILRCWNYVIKWVSGLVKGGFLE
jgi:hypothetical protein